jgi:iron-sulfur cluster insertion protein
MQDRKGITISDNARKRIDFLLASEPSDSILRISVEGGGCSGFQYHYEFEIKDIKEDDINFDDLVVIDNMSADIINNAQIDYIINLTGSHFEIKNPNASSGCGCGNSFSI